MKSKAICLLAFFMASSLLASDTKGLHCGTRGTMLGTIASDVLIPEYFPPENRLLRFIFANPMLFDLSVCEQEFSSVYLGASCMEHDQCYGTLGNTKDSCDEALIAGWEQSCVERYGAGLKSASLCAMACNFAVNLMYRAMRYDDGVFCPSCRAYEVDQEEARSREPQF